MEPRPARRSGFSGSTSLGPHVLPPGFYREGLRHGEAGQAESADVEGVQRRRNPLGATTMNRRITQGFPPSPAHFEPGPAAW